MHRVFTDIINWAIHTCDAYIHAKLHARTEMHASIEHANADTCIHTKYVHSKCRHMHTYKIRTCITCHSYTNASHASRAVQIKRWQCT